jgi:hypothetical protein
MSDVVYLNGQPMHFWQAWQIKVSLDAQLNWHWHELSPEQRAALIERLESMR